MNDKRTTHTAGPWKLLAVGDGTSRMCPADADGLSLLTIVDEDGGDFAAVYKDADARLIAAAPDHALICWAVCVAAGRWEPSSNGGEFCINGIRYSTKLDEFGCPVVNGPIRAAILKAQGTQS